MKPTCLSTAVAIILALLQSVTSFGLSSHRYAPTSSSSIVLPTECRRISCSSMCSSRLYSASAALSPDGSLSGDVGDRLDLNYGPGKCTISIEIGSPKWHQCCGAQMLHTSSKLSTFQLHFTISNYPWKFKSKFFWRDFWYLGGFLGHILLVPSNDAVLSFEKNSWWFDGQNWSIPADPNLHRVHLGIAIDDDFRNVAEGRRMGKFGGFEGIEREWEEGVSE